MLAAVLIWPVDRHAGQPDADRHACVDRAVALASRFTSRPIEAMTASGVDGFGVGDPQALGHELPGLDVDDGGLDPAAADVDADREPAAAVPSVTSVILQAQK